MDEQRVQGERVTTPNHVTNWVHIKGTKRKIAALKRKLARTDKHGNIRSFDFNALIPMPPSLDIVSDTSTDEGMAAFSDHHFREWARDDEWMTRRYGKPIKTKEELLEHLQQHGPGTVELGRTALDNIDKYGYSTWYDWCIHNWGTKWNAYNDGLLHETDHDLYYRFDTAWSSPDPIFDKLEENGFSVDVFWSDEGGPTGERGDPWECFDIDTSPRVAVIG